METPNILAVEIGNAETVMGLFAGEELLASRHLSTRVGITPDEALQALQTFRSSTELPAPDDAIICSVVPSLTATWTAALQETSGRRPLVIGPGLKSGIAMAYKDPGQIGSDRVVCAVAARARYGAPVIVVDFGVATSITIVDENGALLGGTISLGVQSSMEALGKTSAQLIEVDLRMPKQAIGRTTADAIRSGIILGEAKRADGLIASIWSELGYRTALVATGRYAHVVCEQSDLAFEICDELALCGMQAIYALNRR